MPTVSEPPSVAESEKRFASSLGDLEKDFKFKDVEKIKSNNFASKIKWDDWKWQLKNCIKTI